MSEMSANESGMTLVVGLIMLLVITLFVVSAVRLSTANLRTVGNMQARNEAAAASQRAIEDMMSSTAAFTAPAAIVPAYPSHDNCQQDRIQRRPRHAGMRQDGAGDGQQLRQFRAGAAGHLLGPAGHRDECQVGGQRHDAPGCQGASQRLGHLPHDLILYGDRAPAARGASR